MVAILSLLFVLALLFVAVAVVRKQRTAVAVQAETLEAPVTEQEIKQTIREHVPALRPYSPGQFGADNAGRKYVVGMDGAMRRVEVIETEDGGFGLYQVRKLGKSQRRKRRAEIRTRKAKALCTKSSETPNTTVSSAAT